MSFSKRAAGFVFGLAGTLVAGGVVAAVVAAGLFSFGVTSLALVAPPAIAAAAVAMWLCMRWADWRAENEAVYATSSPFLNWMHAGSIAAIAGGIIATGSVLTLG